MPSITKRTYGSRAAAHPIPVAQQLLACCERKQTNLCVSVDVTKKAALLRIAAAAGPYICCVKVRSSPCRCAFAAGSELTPPARSQTHIDIVEDFDQDLVQQLQALADKHDFLIWEDRKFADIGASPLARRPFSQARQLTLSLLAARQAIRSGCSTRRASTRSPRGRTSRTHTSSRARAS